MAARPEGLAGFTVQARKIFLLALPFAVLFWAFGINFGGAADGGKAWINAPMLIAASAFLAWVGGSLALMVRGTGRIKGNDDNA